ncbi:unnamed protein product [Lactuca saligna]|uniref:FAR1 domain-containing protein n=1 Tax=Lactuca saligna TaxID=75948 RepID=A0AA35VLY1_LACSI|nr:unnamed protein product [Lactuca saligna]
MGDQEADVNNHMYEEHYLASDDGNGIEDFDFPDNDTLYNDGFQTGESSNPNLEEANNDEDENHFVDEDIEVNIDYSEGQPHVTHEDIEFNIDFIEGQPHVTHDYVSPVAPCIGLDCFRRHQTKISSKFNSYGEAETMYRKYALESGFDVRLGRVQKMKNGIITNRHLVCNREGNPNTSKLDTLDIQHKKTQRRKDLFRRNCKAKVVLEIIPGTLTYVVSDFVERHNHELFSKGNMHLSRSKRKLDYSQEIFIHNLSKQNIGPVKAHRLYSALQILSIEDATTNQKFRKRFHSIIWNSKLEPHEFENVWRQMLEEFKITDNTWMNTMYGLRKSWIPAFFKHIPMSGLMRTTSLSESQNWSFQTTTLTGSYLVMFMMTFESVMERQRHNQILNDFNTATTFPKFITRTPYEPHASNNVISSNGVDTIIVMEKRKNITIRQTNDVDVDDKDEEYNYDCLIRDTEYMVTHSTKDGSFKCTCMHFEHLGMSFQQNY